MHKEDGHRKEVQAFILASEQLYKLLAGGGTLNVWEAETIRCCLDELLVRTTEDMVSPGAPSPGMWFPRVVRGETNADKTCPAVVTDSQGVEIELRNVSF